MDNRELIALSGIVAALITALTALVNSILNNSKETQAYLRDILCDDIFGELEKNWLLIRDSLSSKGLDDIDNSINKMIESRYLYSYLDCLHGMKWQEYSSSLIGAIQFDVKIQSTENRQMHFEKIDGHLSELLWFKLRQASRPQASIVTRKIWKAEYILVNGFKSWT